MDLRSKCPVTCSAPTQNDECPPAGQPHLTKSADQSKQIWPQEGETENKTNVLGVARLYEEEHKIRTLLELNLHNVATLKISK